MAGMFICKGVEFNSKHITSEYHAINNLFMV